VYPASVFVIFRYIGNQPSGNDQKDQSLRLAIIGGKITQYVLGSLTVFIVLEILVYSSYTFNRLILIASISYFYAVIIMSFFTIKLIQWLRKAKNKTVLLYVISGILLIVNLMSSLVYTHASLAGIDSNYIVIDHPGNDNRFLTSDPHFYYMYLVSSIFSFFSSWIASIFLLKSYYRRFPRVLFWVIIIIPLIYFISQYNPLPIYLLQQFLTSPAELIFDYNILYTFSDAMGGILIGVSFWLTGRRISNQKIKKYLYLSSCGYILLFTSNHLINITNLTYPPFGISGIPYVSLSSLLIFIGIYFSAIFIAQDDEIRRFIKKTIMDEGIVGFIGTAESYRRVEDKLVTATKEHNIDLEETSGIETSIPDDKIKEYIKIVLLETKKSDSDI
jgi:hypothetical protein